MTSPKGKAESTCSQNQPKLAQTRRPVHAGYRTGTCHYPDPERGDCGPQLSTTPAHMTFTPTTRGVPLAPARRAHRPETPPSSPAATTSRPTNKNLHKPTCPAPPTTKCTKAAGGEETANDCQLGDPSHKTNPELPTRFPAATCSSPSGVVRAWRRMGSGDPRGSPVPFTGRAETRRPGPRRPFHSRGPGHWGARTHQVRRRRRLLGAKAAGPRSEGLELPLGLGLLLHFPPSHTGPHRPQKEPSQPRCARCAPPTARGERAGSRGSSGRLRARAPRAHHVRQWREGAGPTASAKGAAPERGARSTGLRLRRAGVGAGQPWDRRVSSASSPGVGLGPARRASFGARPWGLLYPLCYFCVSCVYNSRPRWKLQAPGVSKCRYQKRNQN